VSSGRDDDHSPLEREELTLPDGRRLLLFRLRAVEADDEE
jgi:hypothetical protein